jgi:pimeloyl-ACP methyl ester carboxylesterase
MTLPVQGHHGTEDPLKPFAAGQELTRRIPGAQFVVYEGAGHALFLERPEGGERILAFSPSLKRARCEPRV